MQNNNCDDLQSIPRESNDKDVAAMLDELTIEANDLVVPYIEPKF